MFKHHLIRSFLCALIVLFGSSSLLYAQPQGQPEPVNVHKLSPVMTSLGTIKDNSYAWTDTTLFFMARPSLNFPMGLYRASLKGTGGTIRLSAADHEVIDYKLTPDQQYLVYRTEPDATGSQQFYRVGVTGGSVVHLAYPESAGTNVEITAWQISADSMYVVFIANAMQQATINAANLFSININDGTVLELDHESSPYRASLNNLTLSDSSYRLVYTEYLTDDTLNLYTTFITDPEPLLLSAYTETNTIYHDMLIQDPYVYYARNAGVNEHAIIRQPLDGSAQLVISQSAVATHVFEDQLITVLDYNNDGYDEVIYHSMTLTPSILLYIPDQHVRPFFAGEGYGLLPDGEHLLVLSTPVFNPASYSLWLYNIETQTRTHIAMGLDNSTYATIALSNNAHFIYQGIFNDYNGAPMLYNITNMSSSTIIQNNPSVTEYGVSFIDPNEQWLYQLATIDGTRQLYRVALPSGPLEQLNQDLVAGGNVLDAFATPQGVVFKADAEQDGLFELYIARSGFNKSFIPILRR